MSVKSEGGDEVDDRKREREAKRSEAWERMRRAERNTRRGGEERGHQGQLCAAVRCESVKVRVRPAGQWQEFLGEKVEEVIDSLCSNRSETVRKAVQVSSKEQEERGARKGRGSSDTADRQKDRPDGEERAQEPGTKGETRKKNATTTETDRLRCHSLSAAEEGNQKKKGLRF